MPPSYGNDDGLDARWEGQTRTGRADLVATQASHASFMNMKANVWSKRVPFGMSTMVSGNQHHFGTTHGKRGAFGGGGGGWGSLANDTYD